MDLLAVSPATESNAEKIPFYLCFGSGIDFLEGTLEGVAYVYFSNNFEPEIFRVMEVVDGAEVDSFDINKIAECFEVEMYKAIDKGIDDFLED